MATNEKIEMSKKISLILAESKRKRPQLILTLKSVFIYELTFIRYSFLINSNFDNNKGLFIFK